MCNWAHLSCFADGLPASHGRARLHNQALAEVETIPRECDREWVPDMRGGGIGEQKDPLPACAAFPQAAHRSCSCQIRRMVLPPYVR
jgi:hypothetical protein